MNAKILTYVFFGIALIVMLLGALEVIPMATALIIAGLVGFPEGVASLRTYINSSGYKTYLVVAGMIATGLLVLFKVITLDVGMVIYGFLGAVTGITLTQATTKTINS